MSFVLMSLGNGLVNLGIFGRRWKLGCFFEFFFFSLLVFVLPCEIASYVLQCTISKYPRLNTRDLDIYTNLVMSRCSSIGGHRTSVQSL